MLELDRELRGPRRGAPPGSTTRWRSVEALPDHATRASRRVAIDDGLRTFLDRARELPDDDRRLLVHVGLEGLSFAEAGRRIGLSRDAAAKRWQRMRASLAAWPGATAVLDD